MSHNTEVSATPSCDADTRTTLSGGVVETLLHETAGNGRCAMEI